MVLTVRRFHSMHRTATDSSDGFSGFAARIPPRVGEPGKTIRTVRPSVEPRSSDDPITPRYTDSSVDRLRHSDRNHTSPCTRRRRSLPAGLVRRAPRFSIRQSRLSKFSLSSPMSPCARAALDLDADPAVRGRRVVFSSTTSVCRCSAAGNRLVVESSTVAPPALGGPPRRVVADRGVSDRAEAAAAQEVGTLVPNMAFGTAFQPFMFQ